MSNRNRKYIRGFQNRIRFATTDHLAVLAMELHQEGHDEDDVVAEMDAWPELGFIVPEPVRIRLRNYMRDIRTTGKPIAREYV